MEAREPAFRDWLGRADLMPELPGLVGHFPLDRFETNHGLANLAGAKSPAGTTSTANTLVHGKLGQALRFTGDDPADFPAPASLDRAQPLTVAFWLHVPDWEDDAGAAGTAGAA